MRKTAALQPEPPPQTATTMMQRSFRLRAIGMAASSGPSAGDRVFLYVPVRFSCATMSAGTAVRTHPLARDMLCLSTDPATDQGATCHVLQYL